MNGSIRNAESEQSELDALKADVFSVVVCELIKLLLPYGIQYREAERMLGPAFAEAIAEQLEESGQTVSTSRMAVRAGVNRHKAKEWERARGSLYDQRTELSAHARVLKEWFDNPRFLDSSGAPKILTKSGPGVSFFELVESCAFTTDVYPGTLLKDLIQNGSVEQEGEWLSVRDRHFVTKTHSLDSLRFGLISTRTVLKTNHYNCNTKPEDSIGRINKLAYADVPASQAAEIEEEVRKDANEFLTIISKKLESFCVDLGDDEPTVKLGIGVYGLNDEGDTPD